jgi:hypothetical protein
LDKFNEGLNEKMSYLNILKDWHLALQILLYIPILIALVALFLFGLSVVYKRCTETDISRSAAKKIEQDEEVEFKEIKTKTPGQEGLDAENELIRQNNPIQAGIDAENEILKNIENE